MMKMHKMKKICKKFDKEVKPEVILNNFNTMLGHRVGRMLASVFHYDPNFEGKGLGSSGSFSTSGSGFRLNLTIVTLNKLRIDYAMALDARRKAHCA